jgi:hypothetical protein
MLSSISDNTLPGFTLSLFIILYKYIIDKDKLKKLDFFQIVSLDIFVGTISLAFVHSMHLTQL